MKTKQNGFSTIILIALFAIIILIASASFLFIRKSQNNTVQSVNESTSTATPVKQQASNKETVNTIDNDIKGLDLDKELPNEDLEKDINSLL